MLLLLLLCCCRNVKSADQKDEHGSRQRFVFFETMNMSPSIFRSPVRRCCHPRRRVCIQRLTSKGIQTRTGKHTHTTHICMKQTVERFTLAVKRISWSASLSLWVWSFFGNAPNCSVIYMRRTETKLNIQINENKSTWRRHDTTSSLCSFLLLSHWQSVSIFLAIDSLPLWRFTIFFVLSSLCFSM